jgi:hypothetical protein
VKEDDDWCVHCGSEGCQGECLDEPVDASLGARLERLAQEEQARNRAAVDSAILGRLEFPALKIDDRSLEAFEAEIASRPRTVVARRRDGVTYRKKVG